MYEDVATGHSLARVKVENAHSLSVLELTAPGRNGQTLLAFIENEKHLRVVQYKGRSTQNVAFFVVFFVNVHQCNY